MTDDARSIPGGRTETGTLTDRLLRAHLVSGGLRPGEDVGVAVDQILIEDATGTMCAMQFEQLGVDGIRVPLAVMYIDHNVLQIDDRNMQDHRYLESFSRRHGLHLSPAGNGISHYVHLERFGVPGELLLGADSHTSSAGALGMFALGAGGLEVAAAMAGYGFDFPAPRVIGTELRGRLSAAVEPKDIVLELLRRFGVRGGRGAVFEFFGEGLDALPVPARATIANMIIETGATTAVFPSDDLTREWLRAHDREDAFRALAAEPGARYDETLTLDLHELEPLIARPPSPGDVVAVSELEGAAIGQVCFGSSVNSSFDDFSRVADVLRGHRVAAGVQVTATPGSRRILATLIDSGLHRDLMAAGVRMLEPICGPCVGIGDAPLRDTPSLRTFNRNFPGRSGTAADRVYLCSPSTAAASALTGRITDPRRLPAAAETPSTDRDGTGRPPMTTFVAAPLPPSDRADVLVERGPALEPPEAPPTIEDLLCGPVLIVVGDDVSTGDMAPDGVIAMSVWSNIDACASEMFRRIDPTFPARARESGGGFIVGGENYGQGSSREHAALSPIRLGIRAILARSYARIHRRNLIACGLPPLLLGPDDELCENDEVTIEGLATAIRDGATSVQARAGGRPIRLGLDLSEAERVTLAAGGLIAELRAGGRPRAEVVR